MTDHLTAPEAAGPEETRADEAGADKASADKASRGSAAGAPAAGGIKAAPASAERAEATRASATRAGTSPAGATRAGAAGPDEASAERAEATRASATRAGTSPAGATRAGAGDPDEASAGTEPGAGGGSGPARGRRRWRRVLVAGGTGLAVVLAAAGAFLAWGPVGLGPGPLAVASVSAQGIIPAAGRTVLVIPVGEVARTPAVIDSVSIRGAGKYGAPGLFAVMGTASQDCAGIWAPATGPGGFVQRCAPGGTIEVTGHLLPERDGAWGTSLGLVVGPPGTSGCWSVSRVIIRYHVGRRHYTVTGGESLFGCTSQ
jgi:hypothetical protein